MVTAIVLLTKCAKETSNIRLSSQLTTAQYLNLTSDSVTIVGFVIANNGGFAKEGVCYNTDTLPTTANKLNLYTGSINGATFNVQIKTSRLTKYHARAFGEDASGNTYYGTDIVFTTPAALPILAGITAPQSSAVIATQDSGVTVQTAVNITDDGWLNNGTVRLSARGVVYGLSANPIIDSTSGKGALTKTFKTVEGTADGKFTSLALNLLGNKTYYLRAYATNAIGNGYSNVVSFTTPTAYATITTNPVSNLSHTSVTLNGTFTYNGGGTVTDQGFVYGATANPTVKNGTKISVPQVNSAITYNLTGLIVGATYHVRSYVQNQVGINYGADVQFTTLPNKTVLYVVGDYNSWTNTAGTANDSIVTPPNNPTAQGYVFLKKGGFKLIGVLGSWANATTYGDDGTNKGILSNNNGGSNITVPADGYYLIQASLSSMTYSILATTWSIIGNAPVLSQGWANDVPLTYYPSTVAGNGTWGAVDSMVGSDALKFRANDSWNAPNPNYGSTNYDTLVLGGNNINVPATSTYYQVVLNLSAPNVYTYQLNTWSIIGSVTKGGNWSTDVPLTWDPVNNVFKVTTTLLAGQFKFRANDSWNAPNPNYGSATGNGILDTANNNNINIATAGTYTITMNPLTMTYSIKQN